MSKLDIRKKLFSVWSGTGTAAQGVVESPSLEVFQSHGDLALRDVGSMVGEGCIWAGGSWRSFPTSVILWFYEWAAVWTQNRSTSAWSWYSWSEYSICHGPQPTLPPPAWSMASAYDSTLPCDSPPLSKAHFHPLKSPRHLRTGACICLAAQMCPISSNAAASCTGLLTFPFSQSL